MEVAGSEAAGRKLGRYHLVEPIGGGPTGEVYRAKVYGVAGFERQFAVKRFHPEFVARADVAAELARAARVYGSLEHPRIARMHEFGVAGGETFAATELVDGIDLNRLVAVTHGIGEPLPSGAALKLVAHVARAVGYAHGRGIAHLGLCPTNVLVTPEGEVKVTDFCLLPPRIPARPADDYTLVARLPYLAPEQVVGEETGAATDVFALGAVLYELLTGDKAFRGTTPLDITQALLSSVPADPPGPDGVVKLIRRAFARSPFERFPDASALADAIEAAGRSAALSGDKTDVAVLVRGALDAGPSQPMSGAFALPVPAPPPTASAAGAPGPGRAQPAGSVPPPMPLDGAATVPRMPAIDDEDPTGIRAPDGSSRPAPAAAGRARSDGADGDPGPAPVVELMASPAAPGEAPNEFDMADSSLVLGADPSEVQSGDFDPVSDSTPVPPPMPLGGPSEGATGQELALSNFDLPDETVRSPRSSLGPALAAVAVAVVVGVGFAAYSAFFRDGGADDARAVAEVANQVTAPDGIAGAANSGDSPAPRPVTVPIESEPLDESEVAAATAVEPSAKVTDSDVAAVPPDNGDVNADADSESDGEIADEDDGEDGPPVGTAGKLSVETRPEGARVFLDGTEVGATPLSVDVAADSHTVAVVKAGYALFLTEVAGSGTIDTDLIEVSKPGGAAGIKVRCKDKDRYYIILDGRDTGQLCPSERLGVKTGEHIIDIYDPISEERKTFSVTVDQTDRSVRLRID